MSACCLVGLCGATPAGIESLKKDGLLQHLSTAAASGALAFPAPLSPVAAWTTLITGRVPGHHAIFDQYRRESSRGHRLQTVNARDLACEAVWSRLDRKGLRSTILEYPLTVPPPRLGGHVMPGSWATSRQLRFGCHPSDLPRRLNQAGLGHMDEFIIQWPEEEPSSIHAAESWIENQIKREGRLLAILRYLLENEPSHLSAVLFRSFRRVCAWHERSPELRPATKLYFQAVDERLAGLLEDNPETSFLVLSEPGPEPSAKIFYINEWLAKRGDFAWMDGNGPQRLDGRVLDTDQLTRQSKLVDWSGTRAWCPLAGNGDLHIIRRDAEHPMGVTDSEYLSYRESVVDCLTGVPLVERTWTREELYAGPHEELAPDLVIEPKPGARISPLASPSIIDEGSLGNAPTTSGVFFAFGPIFRKGAVLERVSLLDVAPLIYYSLALPVPRDLEGRVPEQAIDPARLQADPPRIEAETPSQAAESPRLDPQAEGEILGRLRSMGYVE